jgi:hypothetical protein
MEGLPVNLLHDLVKDAPLPRLVKIHQKFDALEIADVAQVLRTELAKRGVGERIKPGMKIAIAVGSRGVAEILTLTRLVVEEVKKRGGEPFIVPAMGSHGGATSEGQKMILAYLGLTEETVGCPIISSMEVTEVGRLDNGLAVLIDKNAYEADGIIVINRVKPHTCYRGPCESGMAKMIAIGLGKQKGADSCHAYGFKYMASFVVEMAKIKIDRTKILFGVGTVESAYDKIAKIVAVPAEDLIKTDSEMLVEAKAKMPRFLIDKIDVLVVEQIGKDCSGDGMDPNITGRYPTPYASGGPDIAKLVALDLTTATHGNASGLGAADITTRKLFSKIDFQSTYANVITSTVFRGASIPPMFDTDEDAIRAAVKTCNSQDISRTRMIVIQDTMHMGDIYISESLLEEAKANPNIEILSGPIEMPFDTDGNFRLFR